MLYLQRIEISNFRAYGDSFSLSPPGPGVTILAGPPGLGKSAFFESMEWALTGRVHRLEASLLESLDPRRRNGLLARREADGPVAQYSVSLEFMSGEGGSSRIERRAVREQEDRELFAEVSSPTQQQLIDLLRADSWPNEISDVGEYLRRTHLGGPVTVLELKRDTLLQLSAARTKAAQGPAQKSTLTARIDRATHELWMVQSYLRDTAKAIRQIMDLENRIHSLLLAAQELESCQQAYDEWVKEEEERSGPTVQASHQERQAAILSFPILAGVAWEQIPSHLAESRHRTQLELETAQSTIKQLSDIERLNNYHAELKERIDQLSSEIRSDVDLVAHVEQETLAARALLQQHPELLSALGTLPSDEANATDEAMRAVDQLVRQDRQLIRSEGPFAPESLRHEWSRWPALLLDDPLQPHGLIHPEAFIEILRSLVRDRKYQVILSTHDEALADDIRRKLAEASIHCVTCRYRGMGPTGVDYSTD